MDQVIVSVIMPVYNTREEFLREAIESILNQTFKEFEFIIIDDASMEKIKAIINSYNDKRIRVLTNENNLGVTKSLNKGLSIARGKYIARMDSDDISFFDRFEKQVNYLESNPKVNILGTYVYDGDKIRGEFVDISQKERNTLFLLENVGPIHPSVMIRRSFLKHNNLIYNEDYPVAQDYDLWIRCNTLTNICFYHEPLLFRRKHTEQIGKKRKELQHSMAARIKAEQFVKLLDGVYTKEQIWRIILSSTDGGASYAELKMFLNIVNRKVLKNNFYDKNTIKYVISAYKIIYLRNNNSWFERRIRQIGLLLSGEMVIYYKYRKKHNCILKGDVIENN